MAWTETPFTRLFQLAYPIVQGPFGGGLSSVALTAAVSERGGLGSFGGQPYTAAELVQTAADIRTLTAKPFALNLWVTHEAEAVASFNQADYARLQAVFKPYYDLVGLDMPGQLTNTTPRFEDQIEGIFEARPAVFSFVFGIPSPEILQECRKRGILTLGAATTVEEALALEAAGVDAVVATGMEAGGHRVSFLKSAEESLTGLFGLIPQVKRALRIPVVAAGGIADSAGMRAAFALGADAAQIGTAFLACAESNASLEHKALLFSERARHTMLTKAFSGRLARGMTSRIAEETAAQAHLFAPYPLQGSLMGPLRKALLAQGHTDHITFWAGQNASLVQHKRVDDLFSALVNGMEG